MTFVFVQCLWQLRAIKFLGYFSPNFLFSSTLSCHRQTYFNHTEWNVKKKMNIIPSTTRVDWCAFILHAMLKRIKCYFLSNFISSWKSIFVGAKKNFKPIKSYFCCWKKTFCHICKWPIRSGFASAGNSFWPIRFGFMSVFVVKPCDTPYYCYCEQQYYWFCQMVVMTLYCTCYQTIKTKSKWPIFFCLQDFGNSHIGDKICTGKQCTAIPNVLGFFLFKKCVFMISCSCEMKQLESCCH